VRGSVISRSTGRNETEVLNSVLSVNDLDERDIEGDI
jgi:hypothetical protein